MSPEAKALLRRTLPVYNNMEVMDKFKNIEIVAAKLDSSSLQYLVPYYPEAAKIFLRITRSFYESKDLF